MSIVMPHPAAETAGMVAAEGGEAETFEADVTLEAQVAASVQECGRLWGRLDILHNNVGISVAGGDAEVTEITEEAFDRVMTVNLRGTVMACKHAIPVMREQRSGAIVNISSVAAVERYPWVAYKASKMGMVAFTKQIAIQNAEYGIRANVILPGMMDTPMAVDTRARAWKPSAGRDRRRARRADSAWRPDGHRLGRRVRGPLPRLRRGALRHRGRAARRRGHRLPDRVGDPRGMAICRSTSDSHDRRPRALRRSVGETLPILHVKQGFDSREPFLHVGDVVLKRRDPGVHIVEPGVHSVEFGVQIVDPGVHAGESGVHGDESGVHGDESGVHVGGDGPEPGMHFGPQIRKLPFHRHALLGNCLVEEPHAAQDRGKRQSSEPLEQPEFFLEHEHLSQAFEICTVRGGRVGGA